MEYGYVGDDDRLVVSCDFDVVVLASRAGAQGHEVEPDDATALGHNRDAAALDLDRICEVNILPGPGATGLVDDASYGSDGCLAARTVIHAVMVREPTKQ